MKPSVRELEKRLRDEPDNLGLRVMLAGSLHEVGREAEAVDLYRSVAIAYRDQGRTQQAIAVCRSILDIAPDDAIVRGLLQSLAAPTSGRPTIPRRPSTAPQTDETPLPRALPHHVADPTTGTIKKLSDLDLELPTASSVPLSAAEPATERVELAYPVDTDTEDEIITSTAPALPAPPPVPGHSSARALTQQAMASAFFAPIPGERRAAIATKFTRRAVSAGTTLLRVGETAHPLVLVLAGRLDVRARRADGTPVVVGSIAPGEFIGERSLLARAASVLEVVVASDGEVMVLEARDFYEVAAAFPALWSQLKDIAARRTREYDSALSAS